MQHPILRSAIYFISLDPVFGAELGGFKVRPVVVVSVNLIQNGTSVAIVVPGTSEKGKSRSFQNEVLAQPDPSNQLESPTIFRCHQVRAISLGRMVGRPSGKLVAADMKRIENALNFCLGLDLEPRVP